MANATSSYTTETGHGVFKGMDKKKKSKTTKPDSRQQVTTGEHGRYQIKSGLLAGRFVARAFPKPPSSARGLIAEATGATEEAAIAALHDAIDARETNRAEARRTDAQTGIAVPSVEEYSEALGQIPLTQPQRAMLIALSLAEEEGLSEADMAYASGYKTQTSAKKSFTNAGRAVATYLATDPPSNSAVSGPEGVALLGFQETSEDEDKTGNWVLHPELRQAIRAGL